jgi:hypothetical protein
MISAAPGAPRAIASEESPVAQDISPPIAQAAEGRLGTVVSSFGFILAISYPVLALSTGFRSVVQLLRSDITNYLAPTMSGVAALCYLIAALGFAYRRRWTWYLSLVMLALEMVMVLLVGTLSFIMPEVIGRTVWRHYGADYGYFPLFQPLLGLIWLCWPATIRAYGIRRTPAATPPDGATPA